MGQFIALSIINVKILIIPQLIHFQQKPVIFVSRNKKDYDFAIVQEFAI